MVKNPPANAGDIDAGSILELERSPGKGHDIRLQYSYLENFNPMGLQSIVSQRVRHD